MVAATFTRQEKLKAQFEEEQQRLREKEEKARQENERLKREAEEKRLAIVRANEERERKAQERLEREQREMAQEETSRQDEAHRREAEEAAQKRQAEQAAQRPRSPPIPTLRQGGSAAAPEQSAGSGVQRSPPPVRSTRRASPPPPAESRRRESPPPSAPREQARRQADASWERPRSRTDARPSSRTHSREQQRRSPPRSRQEQTYEAKPKSTQDVMQQLSQLRERLAREQKKSDHQLQRGQEQFQNLQANAQQRQLKGKADVFERIRRQASVRSNPPPAHREEQQETPRARDGQDQSNAALEAFNKLKYGGGLGNGKAKDQFVQVRNRMGWRDELSGMAGLVNVLYRRPGENTRPLFPSDFPFFSSPPLWLDVSYARVGRERIRGAAAGASGSASPRAAAAAPAA